MCFPDWKTLREYLFMRVLGLSLFLLGISFLPYFWCSREADSYFDDSYERQLALQAGTESWLKRSLGINDYKTSSKQFSGEWLFGTYLMAGLGFGQMALLHPGLKERNIPLVEECIAKILSPEVRQFDKESWGDDPLETLGTDKSAHMAYLGYLNLLLSLDRLLHPGTSYARLNDDITAALARRLEKSPILLIETYPCERYPVDNCSAIASFRLYDRATGADHSELIRRWIGNCRERYLDKKSGLLIQAVGTEGQSLDAPRGSGSTLGLYFLSYADPLLAKSLYAAVKRELAGTIFSFGAVREYPRRGFENRMDIDSGPIILGYGFSSTGFCLAGSRIFGDRAYFRRLYATAYFAGAPFDKDGARTFVTGGPLGTAILFAMLTAAKEGAQ